MRVIILAAGAGGMICGSCVRDNRLALTLREQGRDVLLVPAYTPLRTDEASASESNVVFGGVNVYLQQRFALFRALPAALDRVLNGAALLRRLTRSAGSARPSELADLTLSVLSGSDGRQKKELDALIESLAALRPNLVNLPNLMFLGMAGPLRERLGCAVACTLSGEDVFLDELPDAAQREAHRLIEAQAQNVDTYIAVTRYYAAHATGRYGLPVERVQVAPLGIATAEFLPAGPRAEHEPLSIGYLARITPEKGLARLAEAFVLLRRRGVPATLHIAGYQAAKDVAYAERVRATLAAGGVTGQVHWHGELTRVQKRQLLERLHVLSVPSDYPEAKGLYVLEALAAGVPVVQPRHGSFVELVEATGGGVLVLPGSAAAVADALEQLYHDEPRRRQYALAGRAAVAQLHDHIQMAEHTWRIYQDCLALAQGKHAQVRAPAAVAAV